MIEADLSQKVQIKICGLTSAHDAQLAFDAEADWLGLIFVSNTPRYVFFRASEGNGDDGYIEFW